MSIKIKTTVEATVYLFYQHNVGHCTAHLSTSSADFGKIHP